MSSIPPNLELSAHILVVDDDREVRLMYREGLRFHGYRVSEATDGLAALEVVASRPVDLVISDVAMPRADGIELLASLRDRFPHLPVILVTGFPAIEAAVECIRLGAVDYLTKPIELERLIDLVRQTLASRQAEPPRLTYRFEEERPIPREYTCLRTLGSGSAGTVYLVRHVQPPYRLRALKCLRLDGLDPIAADRARSRFSHEVEAAMRVDHPNVVRYYEHGTAGADRIPYAIMEYVSGQPLSFLIRHDVLTFEQRLDILRQSAAGLAAIHDAGICHRDVKPDNLLVDAELRPKLADFGIARLPNSQLTLAQTIIGSPAYMAPEAFTSARVTSAADIFSWAVVACELLQGQRLFRGRTLAELISVIASAEPVDPHLLDESMPPALRQLLLACLSKHPERRPSSMHHVIEQLSGGG